jgi:hypothetical protein
LQHGLAAGNEDKYFGDDKMNSLKIVFTIALTLAICGAATGIDSTTETFCGLSSSREGSRVTVDIRDGGYSYERVEGIVGSNKNANWSIAVNGNEQRAGALNPGNGSSWATFRVNLPAGNTTITVKIGNDVYGYTVEVLNRSVEDRILQDTIGNITSPFKFTIWDMIKAFGSAWGGLVAALVVGWIIIRDKLTQEIQEIL